MEKIDRYEIIKLLGKGGMASVYLAKDPRFDRDVAIKVLPREFMHEDTFMARFEQEAKTVAKLEHNAIAPVYDYGEYEDQPYLVMRYMAGGSLKDKFDEGLLPTDEILQIIQRIAQALHYAHQAGIIHRDIKPGNILFDAQDVPYLGDFGIAKLSDSTANLTGSGIIGTPAYMSPEQVRAQEKIDGRSDVYSLGIMLFEMLVGKQPFEADTPMGIATAHLMDPVPDIREMKHDLPVKMTEVIHTALEKDRELRYQDPVALSLALEDAFKREEDVSKEFEVKHADEQPPLDLLERVEKKSKKVSTPPVAVPQSAPAFNVRKILTGISIGIILGVIVLLVAFNFDAWFGETATVSNNRTNNSQDNQLADAGSDNMNEDASGASADASVPFQDSDCALEGVLCVGLVTDMGEVDDKSFNQSAWNGVLLAESELGAHVEYVETRDAKDYAANMQLFLDRNYDVIVTVGFALGEATANAAAANPDVYFIGVDQWQGWGFDDDTSNDLSNLVGLIFHEDQAGFMAGALAATLSQTGMIAGVYGSDFVPPVVAFSVGYENGAKYINPDIEVITSYHPGGLDVAFTDPEWGATTAAQAIDSGADVIFGAGGKTGNGAIIEAAGREGVFCIGVDTDQWDTVPEAHSCLVSSAMKLITPGVFDLINWYREGTMPSDNFFGHTGLAPFHEFDSIISADVKVTLEEIADAFADNLLQTGY